MGSWDLNLDLNLDLDLGSGPWIWTLDLSPTGPEIDSSRILYLRYTGFKGFSIASNNLSLGRPRIGYGRLVSARN